MHTWKGIQGKLISLAMIDESAGQNFWRTILLNPLENFLDGNNVLGYHHDTSSKGWKHGKELLLVCAYIVI